MKIAVIGAGVVGVTTAYELVQQGHDVHVFERNSSVAEESSFACPGVVSVLDNSPLQQAGLTWQLMGQLWQKHRALRVIRPSWSELRWLWQTSQTHRAQTVPLLWARYLRLSAYSQALFKELQNRPSLSHEHTEGWLMLLRSDSERQHMQTALQALRDHGLSWKTLNAQEAQAMEPALRADTPLAEALYFANDEVGNCRQFTLLLKKLAEMKSVQFHFNTDISPLSRARPKALMCANGEEFDAFDAVVVCAGLSSAELLAPLGLALPMAAVHGYSISAAVRETLDAPRSGVFDTRYKVAITRIGQRVRVSGATEIGGNARNTQDASIQTLYQVLDDWFPGAARTQDSVQIWKGSQPTLPDGLPVIGTSGIPGLWLNLGHGANGWALACGCARVIADAMSGNAPEIDLEGLGIDRWQH